MALPKVTLFGPSSVRSRDTITNCFDAAVRAGADLQSSLDAAFTILLAQHAILSRLRARRPENRAPNTQPDSTKAPAPTPGAGHTSSQNSGSGPSRPYACLYCQSPDHQIKTCPTCPEATRKRLRQELHDRLHRRHAVNKIEHHDVQRAHDLALFSPDIAVPYCLDYGADTCILSFTLVDELSRSSVPFTSYPLSLPVFTYFGLFLHALCCLH